MEKFETILYQIENLRQKLNQIAIEKGVSNVEVIQLSKQLDEVLNKYQRMINKK